MLDTIMIILSWRHATLQGKLKLANRKVDTIIVQTVVAMQQGQMKWIMP